MEKRVLLTELVDRGSHLRKEITPTATITDNGKYPAGTFWDANKTLNEIVHGATEAQDTLKEVEDKLNGEITRAQTEETRLDRVKVNQYNVTNIKTLTGDFIDTLKAGSVINKEDGNKKHSYTVAYKKDTEMSLVYVDHETIEEVYYEKVGGEWQYIQTDTFKPEDYLTETQTKAWVNDKIDDLLGIDADGISDIKAVLDDSDTLTGILSVIAAKANSSSLATVATSGSYTDLINKPTIPSIWTGTQAQYDLIDPIDPSTIYIIQ